MDKIERLLSELNSEQKEAVIHKEGPLLIVAGAGTGKTKVITSRIAYIHLSEMAKPSEILGLTFTEKAAQEMIERIDIIMPLGYEESWISTFHSFCDRILREEGLDMGLNTRYNILSEAEQWFFIRKNLTKFPLDYYRPLGDPSSFIFALLHHFNRAKDNDISVQEYLDFAESLEKEGERDPEEIKKIKEMALSYKTYQDLMLFENNLDFGDLQSFALKLFRERPSIRKKYQKKFKYVLVDEFQDTNYAQNELLKLLVSEDKNITVCGDDDQSIYKFRGASITNILQFRKIYPEARVITLVKNYRSPQTFLNYSHNLIKNNNPDRLEVVEKIDKRLISQKKKDSQIEVKRFRSPEEEAAWVTERIIDIQKEGFSLKDFAILARNNIHLNPFIIALRAANIPYSFVGNRGLYDQEEVKYLITYLKVLKDPQDNTSLFNLISQPLFEIDMESCLFLLNLCRKNNSPLFKILEDIEGVEGLNEEKKAKFIRFREMIKSHLDLIPGESASQILKRFLEESGYLKGLLEEESVENYRKIQNINLFFQKVLGFEGKERNPSLISFVDYLEGMMEAEENPPQAEAEDIDVVNLSTVHSAKGLEFPVLFLVQLVDGRFPSRYRREEIPLPDYLIKEEIPPGDFHIQEERRLFYVGMTRAKERLFLTSAQYYTTKKIWKTSPFLKETIGKEKIDRMEKELKEKIEPLSLFQPILFPERPIEKTPLKLHRPPLFSYSQIYTYERCPYSYKLRYLFRLPELPSMGKSFGQTVHLTLKDFFEEERKGRAPTLKDLLDIYERNWQKGGFFSAEEEELRKKIGREELTKFYQNYPEKFSQPIYLEKGFKIKIGEASIRGRIDRIDKLSDGGYEVIDYKTSASPKRKDISKGRQLSIYALACQDILGSLPWAISYYYLRDDKKVSLISCDKEEDLKKMEERVEKDKKKISEIIEKIKNQDFPPLPNSYNCRHCSYRLICKYSAPL